MIHPKFGTKFSCWKCAAKFYDMKKAGPKCPKCGSDPKDDPALKTAEKTSKKGGKEGPGDADEFDDEKYEADMDDLVNEEEEADEDPADVDEVTGTNDEE